MELWCGVFGHTNDLGRQNILWLIDPDFIEMLDDPENFNKEEFESLFGASFLQRIIDHLEATSYGKLLQPVGHHVEAGVLDQFYL